LGVTAVGGACVAVVTNQGFAGRTGASLTDVTECTDAAVIAGTAVYSSAIFTSTAITAVCRAGIAVIATVFIGLSITVVVQPIATLWLGRLGLAKRGLTNGFALRLARATEFTLPWKTLAALGLVGQRHRVCVTQAHSGAPLGGFRRHALRNNIVVHIDYIFTYVTLRAVVGCRATDAAIAPLIAPIDAARVVHPSVIAVFGLTTWTTEPSESVDTNADHVAALRHLSAEVAFVAVVHTGFCAALSSRAFETEPPIAVVIGVAGTSGPTRAFVVRHSIDFVGV
tara:strand:+ start:27 stop:875 length:849 start_codon:yes stop_codon:yes gene_type:complete